MDFKDIKKSFEFQPNYMLIPVYKCESMDEYNDLLRQLDEEPHLQRAHIKRKIHRL